MTSGTITPSARDLTVDYPAMRLYWPAKAPTLILPPGADMWNLPATVRFR
jgi:hypothetical protein